jgi:hypothetical protein
MPVVAAEIIFKWFSGLKNEVMCRENLLITSGTDLK